MKKIFLPVVLVIVALVGLAPVGFGFWAESRLRTMVDDLSQSSEVDLTVLKVDKGWFSSTAIIVAEMSGNTGKAYRNYLRRAGKAGADVPKLYFRANVHHGPIAFTGGSAGLVPVIGLVNFDMRKGVEEDAEKILNIPYTLQTRLELTGNNDIVLDIPEWKGPMGKSGAEVVWKGVKSNISYTSGSSAGDLKLKMPSLAINDSKASFLLENIDIKSDATEGVAGIPVGEASIMLGKIEFIEKLKKTAFKMNEALITAETTESGDVINNSISMTIKSLSAGGENYGPITYTVLLNNLDAGAVGRINKEVKLVQRQNLPPAQVGAALAPTLLTELPTLLQKGPVLEISTLSVKTPYGEVTGYGKLTVDTSNPSILSNPFLIKDAIQGVVNLSIPEAVMVAIQRAKLRTELGRVSIKYTADQIEQIARRRVERQMDRLVKANIFVKDGSVYKIEAKLDKGTPIVNGKVFTMPRRTTRRF